MKRYLLLLPLLTLWLPKNAAAVPYFAVIGNTYCNECHVNPTGGGMRNGHGVSVYSDFTLKKTEPMLDEDFKGRLGKQFRIGGDIRLRYLATIESPTSNSFTIPQGTLYLNADPISHFTLATDTDLANLVNREAYGLVHDLPAHGWIKFGRFNLPYGLRLPDDSAFIRSDLGFTFAAQDIGLELGLRPGPFTLATSLSNGVGGGAVDDNGAKAATWFSEWRWGIFRLGGSFSYNHAATTRTISEGGHTGIHISKLALLGEFDVQQIRNETAGTDRTALVGYGETDYELIQGFFLKGMYDGSDDRLAGSGLHHRISGGFELFPIPYLETSLLYRARIGTGVLGDDQIVALLHGFF